jgi:CheY-like chemotaxis protein
VDILIVDDTDLIRSLIRDMLALLPFSTNIEEAADVPQALSILSRWQPDVVTLDLQLPAGSGLAVLRAIKQAGLSSTVIALTSLADPQIRQACFDAGASFFLEKSSEMEQLPAILRALAGKIRHS